MEQRMEKIRKFFEDEDKFARHAGLELLDLSPGYAKVSMAIKPFHLNGAQTVHGGALFTLADYAFAVASNSHGNLAMGIATSMSFIKAVTQGTVYAEAQEVSKNARLGTYSVRITDQAGEVVALFQGTVYRKQNTILPLEDVGAR